MVVLTGYFDASETARHFSVGGLLFRKTEVVNFDREWRKMLRFYDLSQFHMTDCNSGGGEFKKLSSADRDRSARNAIDILTRRATKGVVFRVRKSDFFDIFGDNGFMPNPFTLGVWSLLFEARHYAETNDPSARIDFVIEDGDHDRKDVEALLNGVREEGRRSASFSFNGHRFVQKRDSTPLQAADILAWHGTKHAERLDKGLSRMRGDFAEIVERLQITDATHEREWLVKLTELVDSWYDQDQANAVIPRAKWNEYVRLSMLAHRGNRRITLGKVASLVTK